MKPFIVFLFLLYISFSKQETFKEVTISLKSVSGKKVIISLSSTGENESNKQLEGTVMISGLILNDRSKELEEISCNMASPGPLKDISCSTRVEVTISTSYHLTSENLFFRSIGNLDDFNRIKVDSTPITSTGFTEFKSVEIKPISIYDKTVTIDLIVDDNDKDKTTTVGAIIELLELIDDNSFNDVINCNIPASSKLSTINCTINTQVKTGVSYRLDGTPFITSDGGDDFGLVTLDKYTQISVDNNVKNDSFGLKITCLIYLFLLFL